MLPNTDRLLTGLPDYSTPELLKQWEEARAVLERVGELGVPQAMGVETRSVLFRVIRALGYTKILDIGTSTGTSALAYALAAGKRGHVVTVDKLDANDPYGRWQKRNRPFPPWKLMHVADVADRVEFVTEDSVRYLQNTPHNTFEFISIDGSHRESVVYKEIRLALKRLRRGGLIFLDDMHPPGFVPNEGCDFIPGPWIATQRRLAESSELKLIHPVDGLPVAFLVRQCCQ